MAHAHASHYMSPVHIFMPDSLERAVQVSRAALKVFHDGADEYISSIASFFGATSQPKPRGKVHRLPDDVPRPIEFQSSKRDYEGGLTARVMHEVVRNLDRRYVDEKFIGELRGVYSLEADSKRYEHPLVKAGIDEFMNNYLFGGKLEDLAPGISKVFSSENPTQSLMDYASRKEAPKMDEALKILGSRISRFNEQLNILAEFDTSVYKWARIARDAFGQNPGAIVGTIEMAIMLYQMNKTKTATVPTRPIKKAA